MNATAHSFPAIEETVVPIAGGGFYPVRRIYCVGRNYVSHIREMKEADATGDLIFTGAPAGVGDRIDARVEGLGPLSITIGPPEK